MSKSIEPQVPAGIERVRAEFESWRAQKRRGERIPETLWGAAARAAKQHGVYPVSRALGLEHTALKRRVGERKAAGRGRASGGAGFVEVPRGPVEAKAGCVIELEKGNGARMRICVEEAAAVDWVRIKEAFLGA